MIDIDFQDEIDWISIRQALALSLAAGKPVRIAGTSKFFKNNLRFIPVRSDISRLCTELNLGTLVEENDGLLFNPERITPGRFRFMSDKFSSLAEMILFLLPEQHFL